MEPDNLPQEIKFTKMHGNGNDFVLIDEFSGEVVSEDVKSELVKAVCDRRFGVGADGLIFIQRSIKADAKFHFFNSDGSIAEMCGNGIRCFSRYVVESGYAEKELTVETLAGIKHLEVRIDKKAYWVKVDMGEPLFASDKIPAQDVGSDIWKKAFNVDGSSVEVLAVNTGVPHAIIFKDDLVGDIIPVAREIRYSNVFPHGANVNFVKVNSEDEIAIRTYERGVEDETLSCGTGSVAAAIIAHRLGLVSSSVRVKTKGGLLVIDIGERTYMTGSASRVFDGILLTSELGWGSNSSLDGYEDKISQ
ncbi:MAG: diaminopimelate epimerase [Candidatus Hadarchaeota archaeon]